ncbi:MAG: lipid A deacylase LpxR family protein [Opitutia bacterium]
MRSSLVLPLCLAASAQAATAWMILEENDKFSDDNLDRYYTQGMRICWMDTESLRHFSIGQEIHTPSRPTAVPTPPGDLPFSGYLYATAGRGYQLGPATIGSVEVVLGVIGPSALGEQSQNYFHEIVGSQTYSGWEDQLHDEPVGNARAEVRHRFDLDGPEGHRWDLIARASAQLGTARTGLTLGAQRRWGVLDEGWGHGFIRQTTAWVDPLTSQDKGALGWCWFADGSIEVQAREYSTEGLYFQDSYSVEGRPIVGQLAFGILTRMDGFALSFAMVVRTKDFDTQEGSGHSFGSFRLLFAY